MSTFDKAALTALLTNGHQRQMVATKHLTLAFAGTYIVATTLTAKAVLVWEDPASSYGRYYVPVETLHPSIKGQGSEAAKNGSNGASKNAPRLETIETLQGKGADAWAADVEKLSIGDRSTTWARFTQGPFKDFIRFEPKEMDAWFENGAIFRGLKNVYKRIDTTPIAAHVVVNIDGTKVAESQAAVLLSETYLNPAYYLPATSILDWGMVEKSERRTECPYKGEAAYFHLNVNGKRQENVVWYYPFPTHESSGVEGLVSFYNKEGVEILVDGVKI